MARDSKTTPGIALTEAQRQVAMERFAVLQPPLATDVPLARAARHAGVPVRTAERWLARYRQRGLAGLGWPLIPSGTRVWPGIMQHDAEPEESQEHQLVEKEV
jgi:hypothetical protein